MPVVLLVRHGQASFGADDYDVLSDLGREQSRVVAAELGRRGVSAPLLVSGSLRRQQDTAGLLGVGRPRVDPRWDEYDTDDLLRRYPPSVEPDGTSRGLQASLDGSLADWMTDPGGSWAAFQDGAADALAEVAAAGSDAVVVSSGGVIAAVCGRLLDCGPAGVVALHRVMVNGSITKVVVGRSGASLVAFNEHSHVDAPDRRLLTYR